MRRFQICKGSSRMLPAALVRNTPTSAVMTMNRSAQQIFSLYKNNHSFSTNNRAFQENKNDGDGRDGNKGPSVGNMRGVGSEGQPRSFARGRGRGRGRGTGLRIQRRYQEGDTQPVEMREVREKQYMRNNERITERDVKEVKEWQESDRYGQRRTRMEKREESVRRKEYLRNRPFVQGQPLSAIEERVEKREYKLRKYGQTAPGAGEGSIVRSEEPRDVITPITVENTRRRTFRSPDDPSTVTHQKINETVSQTLVKGVENNTSYTESGITHQTRERNMIVRDTETGMRGTRRPPLTRQRSAGRGRTVAGSLKDYLGDDAKDMVLPEGYGARASPADDLESDVFGEDDTIIPAEGGPELDDEFDDMDKEYQKRQELKRKYMMRRYMIAERGGPKSKKPIRQGRRRAIDEDHLEHDDEAVDHDEDSIDRDISIFSPRTLPLPLGVDTDWVLDADRTADALAKERLEKLELTPEQQAEIDMANRREFLEQNLHRDDIFAPEELFLRDFSPDKIVDQLLVPLQNAAKAELEKKLESKEITAEEVQLMRAALPGILARTSHTETRNVIDGMVNKYETAEAYSKILTDLKTESGAFVNIEALEKVKMIQLRRLEEKGLLTDEVLDAYEQKMPVDEFLEMVRIEGVVHLLHNPSFNMDAFIEAQKMRGYAARKIRAERNGESEVPPLYTEEEWNGALRRKNMDLAKSLTTKGFSMFSGIKPLDPLTAGLPAPLPHEVQNAIKNRMAELKQMARHRKSKVLMQRDAVLQNHAAVKHAQLIHSISTFEKEYIGKKVPAPYIEDVISSTTAGKLGKDQFLVPFDRNFADLIESMPEGTAGHFRLVQSARALSRNDDLTLREKRYILTVLRDKYMQSNLHNVDQEVIFDPRIAIRPGRYTHLHPVRKSLWDEQYESWIETFMPGPDPIKAAAAEEKSNRM